MSMWRLRTVWLAGFTTLSLASAGCVISDADDSALIFDWGLQYVGDGSVSCDDAGTPTVTLDAEHVQTRNKYTRSFPCIDRRGSSGVLPLGPYSVSISLKDRLGRPVSAIGGGIAEIHRHGLTDLGTILFQIQTWELTWSINRRSPDGNLVSVGCSEVGGQTVQLVTQLGEEDREMFSFRCEDRAGITQAIRTGSYGAQVKLLNTAGQVISQTDPMNYPVTADRRAALSITFDVN
jgi:hypothetical protein